MKMKKLSFALFISLFLINSCIVVKYQGGGEDEEVRMIELSPKPEIPMSDELVRSPEGDMVAIPCRKTGSSLMLKKKLLRIFLLLLSIPITL